MWEESQYDLLFRSSELGADPIARAGLTLASGKYVKAGKPLDKALIDIHLRQLRDDLTYTQREAILRGPKPPAKKEKDKRSGKSTSSPSRRAKSRRRDPEHHLTDDSDSDNDS